MVMAAGHKVADSGTVRGETLEGFDDRRPGRPVFDMIIIAPSN
jgi:hypothetical protein